MFKTHDMDQTITTVTSDSLQLYDVILYYRKYGKILIWHHRKLGKYWHEIGNPPSCIISKLVKIVVKSGYTSCWPLFLSWPLDWFVTYHHLQCWTSFHAWCECKVALQATSCLSLFTCLLKTVQKQKKINAAGVFLPRALISFYSLCSRRFLWNLRTRRRLSGSRDNQWWRSTIRKHDDWISWSVVTLRF